MNNQPNRASIKGYAVFVGQLIVWGSVRPTKEASEAVYLERNPQIEGQGSNYRVLPIAVEIEHFQQMSLDDV